MSDLAAHTPELDALLAAIRKQIEADEAARRDQSPMKKLLQLAQEWLLRKY